MRPPPDRSRARAKWEGGYSEIDSVLYAEPTMAGAKFSIEAIVFVGFVGDDDERDAT